MTTLLSPQQRRALCQVCLSVTVASLSILPLKVNAQPKDWGAVLEGIGKVRRAREGQASPAPPQAATPATAPAPVSPANQQALIDPSPVTRYVFKTAMSESLGTADLTTGMLPIADNDRRLTPAARSALAGLLHTLKLLNRSDPSAGFARFNADTSLTAQDRAQVIGIALAQLRSDARIDSDDSGNIKNPTQIANRTAPGGSLVGMFVSAVPDARDVHFVWVQPDNPAVRRMNVGSAEITTPGRVMSGNLGDFLASAFQNKNPNTDPTGHYYRLYDERMLPLVLARLDGQLAQGGGPVVQKSNRGPMPSQDPSILEGYTGNATNVGGHVTQPPNPVSSGQEEVPKAKPSMVVDKDGKLVIDPATGRPLLR